MRGFTLIELLVVVLIIGILSAVALPQYQKAVEKSRATQALTLLKSLAQAQQAYYMANGEYATQFDQLDVELPWTGKEYWHTPGGNVKDTLSNGEWSLQLFNQNNNMIAIYMGRLSGPYKGVGWNYWLKHTSLPSDIYCAERKGNGLVFDKSAGDYCQRMFSASNLCWQDSGQRVYSL